MHVSVTFTVVSFAMAIRDLIKLAQHISDVLAQVLNRNLHPSIMILIVVTVLSYYIFRIKRLYISQAAYYIVKVLEFCGISDRPPFVRDLVLLC